MNAFKHVAFSLLCFCFLALNGNVLYAQSVSTTESTCQSNGTVSISGGNATSLYALTGPGIPIQLGPFQGPNVTFTDVMAGTFTITEFKDDNTEVTSSATVPGNYAQNWIHTGELTYTPCNGGVPTVAYGNLSIVGVSPAEMRPPYLFRISSKNGTLPADGSGPIPFDVPLSSNFPIPYPSGMGGSYEIQAKDACGNYKTVNIQVPLSAPAPNLNSAFMGFNNCDGDADYKITPTTGVGPFDFEVLSGPNQVGDTYTGSDKTYTLLAGGTYTIRVTDECGGVSETSVTPKPYLTPDVAAWNIQGGACDPSNPAGTGGIKLYLNPASVGLGPVTATVTPAPGSSGCSTPAAQTFDINNPYPILDFNNLIRPCFYTYTVADGCGKTITRDLELKAPGPGSIGNYAYPICPDGASTEYRMVLGVGYFPYNPTFPVDFLLKDASGNIVPGYPKQSINGEEIYAPLPAGTYTFESTDACGATGSMNFDVAPYVNPTVSVDANNICFGQGQANVIGINNRGTFGGDIYSYSVTAGPTMVGQGPESDSPLNTGQFSSLISEGTYTFSFNDGCKTVETSVTIPPFTQPSYEVGFGAICPPVPTADLEAVNLSSTAVQPYTWRITGTDSDLYYSTAPYNGTLPYPNSLGQTDPKFPGLVPKSDGSTATYFFQGVDGCKNSFIGSGKVGPLPEEALMLNVTEVCPGVTTLRARVSIPVVGFKYIYYRDGIEVAQSTSLFTTINPALPGVYTARLVNPLDATCYKETPPQTVTSKGPDFLITSTECAPDFSTYTVNFTSTGTVTADKGSVSGSQVVGVPTGQSVTISSELNGCTITETLSSPAACSVIPCPPAVCLPVTTTKL